MSTLWPPTLEEARKGGLPEELDGLTNRKARAFLANLQVRTAEDIATKVNPIDFVKEVQDRSSYNLVRTLVEEVSGKEWPSYYKVLHYVTATRDLYRNAGLPKNRPVLEALRREGAPSMYVMAHWGNEKLQEFLTRYPEIDQVMYHFLRSARERYMQLHRELAVFLRG